MTEQSPPSDRETGQQGQDGPIRVMLVDDSAVIRGLIARTLEADDGIEIVSSMSNGQMAVNNIKKVAPDVVVLDIEMPIMDGMTALPLLLQEKPDAKILICSTLSKKGATTSMRALALGATECLVKPTSTGEISGTGAFQDDLLRLVKGLGRGRRKQPASIKQKDISLPTTSLDSKKFSLRNDSHAYRGKPALIAIGSSTGGPQALFELLKNFKGFDVPTIITQHMPKTFTTILAEHIEKNCGIPCHEAEQDMPVENGHIYVAAGAFHMELKAEQAQIRLNISDAEPEHFCKPSVNPMMRSAIDIYGEKILAVILTGMGNDGQESCQALIDKGGRLIAQDEESSVVWGMPGAVAMAGLCSEVLPLTEIGPWVRNSMINKHNKKMTGQL